MITPGFIAAHVQFLAAGLALSLVQPPAASTLRPSDVQLDRALAAAMSHAASSGVTAVHHWGVWDDLAVFRRARDANSLRTRIYAAVPLATHTRLAEHVAAYGVGDALFRIGLLTTCVEPSLGSQSASLRGRLCDTTEKSSPFMTEPERMLDLMLAADSAGLQLAMHAIDDRAVRAQLDLIARVVEAHGVRDRRWRMENAQGLHPSDMARLHALDLVASVQPYDRINNDRRAEQVYDAENASLTPALRSMLDHGVPLAFGSDWFAAPPKPLDGIYAAVTHRTLTDANPDGPVPVQEITVDDALRAYTSDAAYAGFSDTQTGVLSRGRLADLVLLDRDITRVAPETLRDTQVRVTVMNGQVVYESAGL